MPRNVQYDNDAFSERKVRLGTSLFLIGFRIHAMYWGATYEGERNCLHLVVDELKLRQPA